MSSKKKWLIALAAIVLFLLAYTWGNLNVKQGSQLTEEQPIPKFELANENGQMIKIPGDFDDRALYMVFFSVVEVPALKRCCSCSR